MVHTSSTNYQISIISACSIWVHHLLYMCQLSSKSEKNWVLQTLGDQLLVVSSCWSCDSMPSFDWHVLQLKARVASQFLQLVDSPFIISRVDFSLSVSSMRLGERHSRFPGHCIVCLWYLFYCMSCVERSYMMFPVMWSLCSCDHVHISLMSYPADATDIQQTGHMILV